MAILSVNSSQIFSQSTGLVVPWKGQVANIFIHPLIVDTKLALSNKKAQAFAWDFFITIYEFKAMLAVLYKQGYSLIRAEDLVEDLGPQAGPKRFKAKPLVLANGRKPVLLTVDDVNYYEVQRQIGTLRRLDLDNKGRLIGEAQDGSTSTLNNVFGILEQFIAEHPHFSHQGARGIAALTGYEGVFGWRTDQLQSKTLAHDRAKARLIAAELKRMGWSLASHSYGHIATVQASLSNVKRDIKKWQEQVASIVGPSHHHILPYGQEFKREGAKQKAYSDAGFVYFWSIGGSMNTWVEDGYVWLDRLPVGGTLRRWIKRQEPNLLLQGFEDIWDPIRK